MLDKGFAAWISRFCCNFDHLGANACHFVQADLVDLLCGQGRRCFFTNAERVIFGTARLRRHAGCCGARWLVACAIPCELFVQRGVNDRADRGFGRLGKACKVRFGNARRALFRIWFVETRCIHVGRNQPADRSFKTLKRHAGLGIFALDRDIGHRDIFIIHARILREPRIVAFKIRLRTERQILRHARKLLMPAGIGCEIDRALPETVALDC